MGLSKGFPAKSRASPQRWQACRKRLRNSPGRGELPKSRARCGALRRVAGGAHVLESRKIDAVEDHQNLLPFSPHRFCNPRNQRGAHRDITDDPRVHWRLLLPGTVAVAMIDHRDTGKGGESHHGGQVLLAVNQIRREPSILRGLNHANPVRSHLICHRTCQPTVNRNLMAAVEKLPGQFPNE